MARPHRRRTVPVPPRRYVPGAAWFLMAAAAGLVGWVNLNPVSGGARIAGEQAAVLQWLRNARAAAREEAEGWGDAPAPESLPRKVLERLADRPPPGVVLEEDAREGLLLAVGGYLVRLEEVPAGGPGEEAPGPAGLAAYAWPARHHATGIAAFVLEPEGRLLHSRNFIARYEGADHGPPSGCTRPRAGVVEPDGAFIGTDGERWRPVEGH